MLIKRMPRVLFQHTWHFLCYYLKESLNKFCQPLDPGRRNPASLDQEFLKKKGEINFDPNNRSGS